jgi:hypothetical protein
VAAVDNHQEKNGLSQRAGHPDLKTYSVEIGKFLFKNQHISFFCKKNSIMKIRLFAGKAATFWRSVK